MSCLLNGQILLLLCEEFWEQVGILKVFESILKGIFRDITESIHVHSKKKLVGRSPIFSFPCSSLIFFNFPFLARRKRTTVKIGGKRKGLI